MKAYSILFDQDSHVSAADHTANACLTVRGTVTFVQHRLRCLFNTDGRRCPLARTYSDVSEGELVALRGSSGLLEIACHAGSAARILGAEPGHVVTFRVQRRS